MTTPHQPHTSDSEHRFLRRWFTVAVVAVIAFAVFRILQPLALAIVWAAFLAFLLQPLQKKYTQKLGGASRAATLLTALTPVAILLPLVAIVFAFAQQVGSLLQRFQQGAATASLQSWNDPEAHPRIAGIAKMLEDNFSISADQLQQWAITGMQNVLKLAAGMSGQQALAAGGSFVAFFLMLFILFFMLRDGARWFKRAAKLVPLESHRRDALILRLSRVTRAVVFGAGLTALVQGVLVGIGFTIVGLPGPVVFAVVATVCALLPFGGAGLVWIPAVLYLATTQRWGRGHLPARVGRGGIRVGQLHPPDDHLAHTPVPTLIVFLGVIGGIAAFGLIGSSRGR